MFKGVPFWAVIVLLVADLAILVHSCLYVLPLYALITPVGSHCPQVGVRERHCACINIMYHCRPSTALLYALITPVGSHCPQVGVRV